MLYAAQQKHASAMTMAYMVTAKSVTNMILSPAAGRLSDSIGRKKMMIGGRLLLYAGTGLFLVSTEEWMLVASWILLGVNDAAGIAWQAEEVELVNPNQRARMTALSISSFNLLAVPASLLGGWLWDDVNPAAPFLVMTAIDGLIRMPIVYKYIPEGRR
jgi:DHA1 family multidrug resistance protein-like MFS transporter